MIGRLTESEWDSTQNPFDLLNYLFPLGGEDSAGQNSRPSQLYLIACAHKAWDRLPACARELVLISEILVEKQPVAAGLKETARRLSEELVSCQGDTDDLAEFERQLGEAGRPCEKIDPLKYSHEQWRSLSYLIYGQYARTMPNFQHIAAGDHCADFLREVFPNPYRDLRVRSEWLTRTVTDLARDFYKHRDFSRMSILEDALQDAGCRNESVLNHCRTSGHIRGCWLLEGILNPPKRL